jgi:hypothetical protein
MALKTSLRPIVRKITEAIAGFAASQGLSKDDYALVGTWDEKTDRISLVFGADRLIDEQQWYSGIFEAIRQAFATEPWRMRDIGLVVENVQILDDVYRQFSVDDDRYDVTDLIERSLAGD